MKVYLNVIPDKDQNFPDVKVEIISWEFNGEEHIINFAEIISYYASETNDFEPSIIKIRVKNHTVNFYDETKVGDFEFLLDKLKYFYEWGYI